MDLKKLRIRERLNKGFTMVSAIATVAAVLGVVATIVISTRYSYALTNYGFAQGDVGKAMTVYAELRSATRGIIGYTDADAQATILEAHAANMEKFEKYWAKVEETLSSDEERKAYEEASSKLEEYWKIDQEVVETGNTTDEEKSEEAQRMAISELTPLYEEIYAHMADIMNANVDNGNSLETTLRVLEIVLIVVIVAVIIVGAIVSKKLGANIAKGISNPLNELSTRLASFAQGDLSSPFPVIDSKDEVADMVQEAHKMADNLSLIISDASQLLGEMAHGNYAIKTQMEEKYMGDFKGLLTAMRDMNQQMNSTLHEIEEASNQVSLGSENLAEAA